MRAGRHLEALLLIVLWLQLGETGMAEPSPKAGTTDQTADMEFKGL